jgi:type IV pilus assembly protein PilF
LIRRLAVWITLALSACGGVPPEQLSRAQREYELGVGLWQEHNSGGAFQHLLQAVQLDPDNAEAHLMLGHLFLFRQEHDRAEHHYREALRANRANQTRASLDAEAHNSLGVLFIHAHRLDDAVTELRTATGDLMNHEPAIAWANLGWAYYEKGEHDEALRALQQAVQLSRELCLAWYRMGQVYSARQDWPHAEESLVHALEFPDESCQHLQVAWRLRGEVRAQLGHREEAITDLERCVELEAETQDGLACARLLEADPDP